MQKSLRGEQNLHRQLFTRHQIIIYDLTWSSCYCLHFIHSYSKSSSRLTLTDGFTRTSWANHVRPKADKTRPCTSSVHVLHARFTSPAVKHVAAINHLQSSQCVCASSHLTLVMNHRRRWISLFITCASCVYSVSPRFTIHTEKHVWTRGTSSCLLMKTIIDKHMKSPVMCVCVLFFIW